MSVARMQRVEVVGYAPVLDDVVAALQKAGVLQVEAAPEGLATSGLQPDDSRLRVLDEQSADARFVRDTLARHHTSSQPFAAFVSEKFHVDAQDFASLDVEDVLLPLYQMCSTLTDRIAAGQREKARLETLLRDLEPWAEVRLQISGWRCTEHVTLLTGTVPTSDGPRVRQMLRDLSPLVSVAEFGGNGHQAWIVLAHNDVAGEVRSALAGTRFAEVTFPGLEGYAAEEAELVRDRIAELAAEIDAAEEQVRLLADERYEDAVALVEALDGALAAVRVLDRFGRTERTFVLSGWVRASATDDLHTALAPWSSDLDITLRDPADDENPPVELDNPGFLRPFEVLTDLYGRPGYREIDPTPLLAPFFLLFFAICIGDVGYGAMLIAGSWLIKTKLDVAPGVKRFLDLMMLGGAAAMVVGVLFGSYFAISIDALPPLLQAMQVLDPLKGLQTFLVITVVLGLTQVVFGIGIAAYDAFRRKDPATAVFEQISTIFLFVMIGVAIWGSVAGLPAVARAALVIGLIGTMLMQGRTFEAALAQPDRPAWDRAAGWLWLAAMLAWVASLAFGGLGAIGWALLGITVVGLAVSKVVRACVVSLLGGAYAVYGMTAFLGDILSYTRLAALGLSGTLVGMVFTLLAGLGGGPVAGHWAGGPLGWLWAVLVAVCAAAVFVFGHVFNVVINLLGAFVHPARLQFVEFFSKFYEGGGRPLAPFRYVTKSVVLSAGEPRREGAGS